MCQGRLTNYDVDYMNNDDIREVIRTGASSSNDFNVLMQSGLPGWGLMTGVQLQRKMTSLRSSKLPRPAVFSYQQYSGC